MGCQPVMDSFVGVTVPFAEFPKIDIDQSGFALGCDGSATLQRLAHTC